MKAYVIILIAVILFAFLWKFMIIAGMIWLILRKAAKEYIKYKYEKENDELCQN